MYGQKNLQLTYIGNLPILYRSVEMVTASTTASAIEKSATVVQQYYFDLK